MEPRGSNRRWTRAQDQFWVKLKGQTFLPPVPRELRSWNLRDRTAVANYFIFIIYLFIYLFLAALGLRCCAWAFSSCGQRGLLFVAVHGLLIAPVAEHGL